MMAWQPCVDGDLIPETAARRPSTADARRAMFPILIGTNRDEYRLFTVVDRDRVNDAELASPRPPDRATGPLRGRLPRRAASSSTYGPSTGERDPGANERWIALQGDRVFHYPATRLADAQCGPPTAEPTPISSNGRSRSSAAASAPATASSCPSCSARREAESSCASVSSRIARRGASPTRCRTPGSPSRDTGEPAADALPDWPAYETHRRYTMTLGGSRGLVKDPHEAARANSGDR